MLNLATSDKFSLKMVFDRALCFEPAGPASRWSTEGFTLSAGCSAVVRGHQYGLPQGIDIVAETVPFAGHGTRVARREAFDHCSGGPASRLRSFGGSGAGGGTLLGLVGCGVAIGSKAGSALSWRSVRGLSSRCIFS